MDLQQKVTRYVPANLDNKLSQNREDIRLSHKDYRENHEKLESVIDMGKKKFSTGENPERYIPGRQTFTISIYNSNDATQSHT